MIALGMLKTTAWQMAPKAIEADVWNISVALFTAALLIHLGLLYASKEVWLAVALLGGVEIQTAACSAVYIATPWQVNPGDDLCAAGLEFPIALVVAWLFACAALCLRKKN